MLIVEFSLPCIHRLMPETVELSSYVNLKETTLTARKKVAGVQRIALESKHTKGFQ